MDLTLIGRALRQNRGLVVLGVLMAVVAGLFSGYSVSSSGLEPRNAPVYRGSSTIILTDPSTSIYAAQIAASAESAPSEMPQSANLSQLAMVYAWVVSGDEIRTVTEESVGDFTDGDSLTAQRRTTQPTGDERFGSNASLPIFDIVTTASSEARAQSIAAAATAAFLDYVAAQQDAAGLPAEQRVDTAVLREPSASLEDGGSSMMSAVLVGVVVLFVVFLLIAYRANSARVRAGRHASEQPVNVLDATPARAEVRGDRAGAWGQNEAVLVKSAAPE